MTIDPKSLFEAGTLSIMEIAHDPDCPGARGDPDNCVCEPEITIHQDPARFIALMTRNRTERRAAERAARKAAAKAAKGAAK